MSAKDYFTCSIKHRLTGIEFQLQSAQIEDVMQLVSRGSINSNPTDWGSVPHYNLELGANGIPVSFPGFSAGRFDLWGNKELLLHRAPSINLSMLLAVGLRNGVKLTIPTVMSTKQVSQLTDGLKSAVRQFYIDFLKETELHIRITTEQFS